MCGTQKTSKVVDFKTKKEAREAEAKMLVGKRTTLANFCSSRR